MCGAVWSSPCAFRIKTLCDLDSRTVIQVWAAGERGHRKDDRLGARDVALDEQVDLDGVLHLRSHSPREINQSERRDFIRPHGEPDLRGGDWGVLRDVLLHLQDPGLDFEIRMRLEDIEIINVVEPEQRRRGGGIVLERKHTGAASAHLRIGGEDVEAHDEPQQRRLPSRLRRTTGVRESAALCGHHHAPYLLSDHHQTGELFEIETHSVISKHLAEIQLPAATTQTPTLQAVLNFRSECTW